MAYACPVCGDTQADGEHLANHVAFAAMLHGDAHADWLDEHVPDWQERDPGGLATDLLDHAEEVDHEVESAGDDHDHAGETPPRFEEALERGAGAGRGRLDEETERIVREAREMTERMYDAESEDE